MLAAAPFRALDRPRVALAVSALVFLVPVLFVLAIPHPLEQPLGVDATLYRDAAARWWSGGPFYEPRQLAGPYEVTPGDILYPPVGLWLFVPLALLPAVVAYALWWLVPAAVTGWTIWRLRPRPVVWPLIALCLAWPTTPLKVWTGNPVIWSSQRWRSRRPSRRPRRRRWGTPSRFPSRRRQAEFAQGRATGPPSRPSPRAAAWLYACQPPSPREVDLPLFSRLHQRVQGRAPHPSYASEADFPCFCGKIVLRLRHVGGGHIIDGALPQGPHACDVDVAELDVLVRTAGRRAPCRSAARAYLKTLNSITSLSGAQVRKSMMASPVFSFSMMAKLASLFVSLTTLPSDLHGGDWIIAHLRIGVKGEELRPVLDRLAGKRELCDAVAGAPSASTA